MSRRRGGFLVRRGESGRRARFAAAQIEGVLRHCTDMEVDRQYTDTHGASIREVVADERRAHDPPQMRKEIHEGLQVVESWNSANSDLFYSKDGDLTGDDKEGQEVSMLALHLLQSSLVHVNTLLMQQVLAEPKWVDLLTEATGGRCPRCGGRM
ncbi:Tn3 family transposase [Streptomyces sp. NPDC056987]|uniref:Tn3 family transposase n=1 Tax=Streptomyces sp. NPDC056987 TaxID=3345988 RepID=UPI00363373A4